MFHLDFPIEITVLAVYIGLPLLIVYIYSIGKLATELTRCAALSCVGACKEHAGSLALVYPVTDEADHQPDYMYESRGHFQRFQSFKHPSHLLTLR